MRRQKKKDEDLHLTEFVIAWPYAPARLTNTIMSELASLYTFDPLYINNDSRLHKVIQKPMQVCECVSAHTHTHSHAHTRARIRTHTHTRSCVFNRFCKQTKILTWSEINKLVCAPSTLFIMSLIIIFKSFFKYFKI